MQILLAVSAIRCQSGDPEIATLVLKGSLHEAAGLGLQRLSRTSALRSPEALSMLAQLLGRALLALGREEEAQECFREGARCYDALPRHSLRWLSTLDQGWQFQHMNRPGRALECFQSLVADPRCPVDLLVEATACMAGALMTLGECSRAVDVLEGLSDRVGASDAAGLEGLVECFRLELLTLQTTRGAEELADHALASGFRDRVDQSITDGSLKLRLATLEREFASFDLVAKRLGHLQSLLAVRGSAPAAAPFMECVTWLKERRLAGLEPGVRIESAMALLARGSSRAASEALGSLVQGEAQARRSRYSLELQYCLSKLYQDRGQLSDSMRLYKQHVEEAVLLLKRDMPQAVRTNGSRPASKEGGDAAKLKLPVKYRGAYQYVVDHLAEPSLSIRRVAAHIGVTERALQLVFRASLGLTPAEFIRRQRMERIREELCGAKEGMKVNVLDVAARWGINNRSTLAHNYRVQFAETPVETLRGKELGDATV